MEEIMLKIGRYKEKQTGNYWECTGYATIDGIIYYHIRPIEGGMIDYQQMTKEEIESKFDYTPFGEPIVEIDKVEPRHPIQIKFRCPECGSLLKTDGVALLSSPVKYNHICSNKGCSYHTRFQSIYSGMFALVTDAQEKSITNGTYYELADGKLIELSEKEAYLFR